MSKFQLIHFNRLECELGRYAVAHDDQGAPLALAAFQEIEIREAISVLEPGDRLELVEIDEPAAAEPDPFAPGAILYSSWGYDQTNVDFYRVAMRKEAGGHDWVRLEKIESVETSDDTEERPATMTGRVVPADPVKPIGEKPILRKIHANGNSPFVKINSYAFAYPWDGTPKRVSHYG
jgi:hypothetical protein